MTPRLIDPSEQEDSGPLLAHSCLCNPHFSETEIEKRVASTKSRPNISTYPHIPIESFVPNFKAISFFVVCIGGTRFVCINILGTRNCFPEKGFGGCETQGRSCEAQG